MKIIKYILEKFKINFVGVLALDQVSEVPSEIQDFHFWVFEDTSILDLKKDKQNLKSDSKKLVGDINKSFMQYKNQHGESSRKH